MNQICEGGGKRKKQNEENLWSLITFLSVVGSHRQAGGRGGNVKINVDGIAAKSGQNGGNFSAAQSSSFGAGSCGNKVQIATFLCFAQLVGETPVCPNSFHLLCRTDNVSEADISAG